MSATHTQTSARSIRLADAIAERISVASLSQEVVADRGYHTELDAEQLEILNVWVVPKEQLAAERQARRGPRGEVRDIDIAIQRKLDPSTGQSLRSQADELMHLAEEIDELIYNENIADHRCIQTEIGAPFDPNRMRQENIFAVTITARFKIVN